jgi:hypothetical protein
MISCTEVKPVIIQDGIAVTFTRGVEELGNLKSDTILGMRVFAALLLIAPSLIGSLAVGQDKPHATPTAVTVPATIDHNRVVIEAALPLPDSSVQRVHAWVDNGNADLEMSRHLATVLGLDVKCGDQECVSSPPREIVVGGLSIPLASVKQAHIPLKPVSAASVLAPGMNAEINIPAAVLRNYDVLIDFPGHKFSIGAPGTIHFRGPSSKVLINSENGLIQIPSQIEGKKYNLALDVGSSISFLSEDVFDKLAAAHADWPHMTGAVGAANMWGLDEEPKWKLMRLDRLQYGPLFLTNVAVVDFPKDRMEFFSKRAGVPTAGLIGSQVLLNYRVGLDYAHSTVYFEIGRLFTFPDFDVIGLVLRPEDDGRFTVLGIADFDGKPSLPTGADGVQPGDHLVAVDGIPVQHSTMGQVWAALGGTAGQERKLTMERGGKQFVVAAKVLHFLGKTPDDDTGRKKSRL